MTETADLIAAGPALKHVWLPVPRRHGGDADTTSCFEVLADLAAFGYNGRVSVAAGWPRIANGAAQLLDELRACASPP